MDLMRGAGGGSVPSEVNGEGRSVATGSKSRPERIPNLPEREALSSTDAVRTPSIRRAAGFAAPGLDLEQPEVGMSTARRRSDRGAGSRAGHSQGTPAGDCGIRRCPP
ncbi:hypothetical protein ZWY2020_022764 [Hordeum vulgare]|nr:hypothetical protein ZWY2020_022764 [Hordeum vulgare]